MTKEEVYKEVKASYDIAKESYLRTHLPYTEGKMDALGYALQLITKIKE